MNKKPDTVNHRIEDYGDYNYEEDFWSEREYENLVEQHVVRRLLSQPVQRLLDIGAGFGRLVSAYDELTREKIVLFDYSKQLLDKAKKRFQKNRKLECIQGSFYDIPFDDGYFDGAVSVRVLHHVEDVPHFFSELNRVLSVNAVCVIEFANKRNVLEICRRIMLKSRMHPFSRTPENRSSKGLTYNFHPGYIKDIAQNYGFKIESRCSSSLFRSSFLKKIFGHRRLSSIEKHVPQMLKRWLLSPSVFYKLRKIKNAEKK